MPISGYFDVVFGVSGTRATVPDALQGDGSVSYTQGYGVDYTLPNSNPSYRYIEQDKFNQLMYDVTSAIQLQQQGSPAPFITSAMNGGSAYVYPAGAVVSSGGVSYISLVGSNADTPPSSKWAVSFSGYTGSFTVGHIATFADTHGTLQDGGAVPSGYTLPPATTSTLGGVIPDGTIITVDGSGHITVPNGSSSAKGVVKVDGTSITASGGVISATVQTQIMTPLGVGSIIMARSASVAVAAGSTTAASNLTPIGYNTGGAYVSGNSTGDTLTGTWQALQSSDGSGNNHNIVLWQRIS